MHIAESLEDRARQLAKQVTLSSKGASPSSSLEKEIALAVEHLESIRKLHEDQLRSLLRSECSVGTDLMQLDSYNPIQFRFMFKIRDNLKNKILQVEKERRHLEREQENKVQDLQQKLLNLLAQLDSGGREDERN